MSELGYGETNSARVMHQTNLVLRRERSDRLEGRPLARSRLWPSFETRARSQACADCVNLSARARSSGRGYALAGQPTKPKPPPRTKRDGPASSGRLRWLREACMLP